MYTSPTRANNSVFFSILRKVEEGRGTSSSLSPSPIIITTNYRHYFFRHYYVLFIDGVQRTDAYANKDFPQPFPTFLSANKVINTNLVPRFSTITARAQGCTTSYSYFPSKTQSNLHLAHIWYLTKKHILESMSTLSVPLPQILVKFKFESVYFILKTYQDAINSINRPTDVSIKIFKHFYGER